MQPQDNDFPLNQVQSGGVGDNSTQPVLPTDNTAPLAAGTTFQPQAGGISAAAPTWQSDAVSDANQVYAQQAGPTANANPLLDGSAPNQPAAPSAEMTNEFNNATNLATVSATNSQNSDMPVSTSPQPQPQPQANTPLENASVPAETSQPQMAPKGPIEYPASQQPASQAYQPSNDPYAQQSPGLPGSESLGAAVADVNQQPQMQQPYQPGYQQPMAGSPVQAPKKSKKLVFIILGIVIGLAVIGGGVFYFLSNRTTTSTNTPSTNSNQTNTTPVVAPSSGPATPPSGYETITKQCYTFALKVPNTVPKDEACSFADSTFGQKQISKIAVETSTNDYKNIDELTSLFKQTITLEKENNIKIDGLDAVQLIYKYTDGRTYSKVFALLVGKNYQQDGKTVTSLAFTTSYQEQFDYDVTNNVIDTWRWK